MNALLVGAGAVGARAARQLVDTPGVDELLVVDADEARAGRLAEALGERGRHLEWNPSRRMPDGVGLVLCAVPAGVDVEVAARAVESRIPVASCGDSENGVRRLLELDDAAREAGVSVAVGAGLAPGLSDVLVRHAADVLDAVDEVHVCRYGTGGPACRREQLHAARARPLERLDGAWVRERPVSSRKLVWFPGPIGAQECRRSASGTPLLVADTVPGARTISTRHAVRRRDLVLGPLVSRARLARTARRGAAVDGGLGGLHVEVRGRRGVAREVLVYGAVDRVTVAAGTVLAVAGLAVAGLVVAERSELPTGAGSLGRLVPPVPFLSELARRGVRAATFDPVAS